jgi:hypothetical protein
VGLIPPNSSGMDFSSSGNALKKFILWSLYPETTGLFVCLF